MPEKSQFLRKILNENSDLPEDASSVTSERQHSAQAFNLHLEKRDGLHAEGFAWSHYSGYKWTDEGSHERLVILFGARAAEILGHNLKSVVEQVREGQLNGVWEMLTAQVELKRAGGDTGPVIIEINIHPDFEELLKEIKGGDEHNTGFARKVRGR